MRIEFRRLDPAARPPSRASEGDAGYDLRATEPGVLEPGARGSFGTGLALAIPEGYAGLVLPRSGLAARHGIALVNSPGLIDAGYRGELRILLLNTDREQRFTVERGDRIAQLVIVAHGIPAFDEVEKLGATTRGVRGFGSSGR